MRKRRMKTTLSSTVTHWLEVVFGLFSTPVRWLALAVLLLVLDYFTGGSVQFPITYIFPVMLAAWHLNGKWAFGLAMAMPLARLGLVFAWGEQLWPVEISVANMLIRMTVLLVLAFVTWNYRAAAREVKILQGIVPICMYCRKIRDEQDRWQPLEEYIPTHSEANLSHGMCPDCARIHFPDVLPGGR
jgi:hypothetical protein